MVGHDGLGFGRISCHGLRRALGRSEAERDWSGRFLGSIAVPQQMTRQPPASAERLSSSQHPAPGTEGAHDWRVWQVGPRLSPSEATQDNTAPLFRSGLQIVHPMGGAAGQEAGSLGLGWGVEVSSQVYLRGSVFGREDGEGGYSLSQENRQLALTASFRF